MKLLKYILQWFKSLFGKKEFKPTTETTTIEVPQRKHKPVNRILKSGTRYRSIKHRANRKAHSKAYTQIILLK